jgi:hypothetical protein
LGANCNPPDILESGAHWGSAFAQHKISRLEFGLRFIWLST